MSTLPANIVKLLLLLSFLLVIFHLALVRWFKISRIGWKRIDYIWLGIAVLGIVTASFQVRNQVANDEAGSVMYQAQRIFSLLREHLGGIEPPIYICRQFQKTWLSPDNFDEIRAEYDNICQWNKELLNKLPPNVIKHLEDFSFNEYKPNIIPINPPLQEYIASTEMYFNEYNKTKSEYYRLKKLSEKSVIE